jgi:hypothetical protein
MNLYSDVSTRMEYIQKIFLDVGQSVENIQSLYELIAFLDTEPPEFRSVAYESASMGIGLKDLNANRPLDSWKDFRQVCTNQHSFHIDIGLGWAFAKTDIQPDTYLQSMNPVLKWMVFDGMGYYYGLFKGRNTVKNKVLPNGIEGESLHGFDQGLGRRLWYMAKGNLNEAACLVGNFVEERHSDLWRGIGIACGYVGGNTEDGLRYLPGISGKYYKQLQIGVVLAAISRIASNTITEDVDLACRIICNKAVNEIKFSAILTTTDFFDYLYEAGSNNHWLTQLQSELLQTN